MKKSSALLLLLAMYGIGCSNSPPTPEEIRQQAKEDSIAAVIEKWHQEDIAYLNRIDTLSIIVTEAPVMTYHFAGPDEISVYGTTDDGHSKRLDFKGDRALRIIGAALQPGDTLTFIIPKKNNGPRIDSSSSVYAFPMWYEMGDYLLAKNGKPFPKK